jgi:CoA:oxalate CoA-transferase
MTGKRKPLGGIRVIDFTSMMSGPVGTRLLADCGADVVKVEAHDGDYMRHRSPIRAGASSYYGQLNCGKRSIAIDLKSDRGREIAVRLIAKSDVLVENYRPGVMRELGLGYEKLSAEFPELIYCSISGFGQTGSRSRDPAYAPIIHAASGLDLAHHHYNNAQDRPQMTGIFTADVLGGLYAFSAIQTALVHRERFGGGQHIDVSMQNALLNLLVYEVQEAQFPVDQNRPLYRPSKAADGFVMVAPVNQKNFERLCEAMGHPEWRADLRFSTSRAREHHWDALMSLIDAWTISRSAFECESVLMKAGVPCARYRSVAELVTDEELRGDGSFASVADRSGEFLVPNPPFRFSNASVEAGPWVADVSEDSNAILSELLGMSASDVAELEASDVIAKCPSSPPVTAAVA